MHPKHEASLEEIEEHYFVANQTFRTEDEFFEFYNNYEKEKGFSVRRSTMRRNARYAYLYLTDEALYARPLNKANCALFNYNQYCRSIVQSFL